jgi:hypothetical protein
MGIRGEIFSSKADGEKRSYFFNVKENRFGDLYLNIAERRRIGEETDRFERRQIVVFKKDLPAFLEAMDKAVRFIRPPRA